MPDSLTKFKKDAPKKTTAAAATATTPPVVDQSGNTISFTPPTKFFFVSESLPTASLKIGTEVSLPGTVDGTMADENLAPKFFERCDLDTSGNSQTQTLPAGITFDVSTCTIQGTPISIKTVTSAFCSNPTYVTQVTCEAAPLTWNASTSKCSNPDFEYSTQAACVAGRNKWYKFGGPIPYRVILKYHNETGVKSSISTTIKIGAYKGPSEIKYTQSDKLIFQVSVKDGYSINDISPVVTTASSNGVYSRSNFILTTDAARGIAKIVDSSLFKIGVNKLVPIFVPDTSVFTVGGFIAVRGTCSNTSVLTRTACVSGGGTWTNSGIIGKVAFIETEFSEIYVENISANNKYFKKGDSISNDANGYSGISTITDIDTEFFKDNESVDNDSQYYTDKFKTNSLVNVYETGSTKTIRPLEPYSSDGSISPANGFTYKISPALPPGLSFDISTGIISGAFNTDLSAVLYSVTATNPVATLVAQFRLSAITAPSDYSVTNRQIITVSNTALFKEGESLYQPIVPPLTEALHGRILKILNGYQLAIETFNGAFLPGASLDNNGAIYKAEKAYIIPYNSCVNNNYTTKATCEAASYVWSPSTAVHYDVAITTSGTGGYTAGQYVNATAGTGIGAKGVVAFVHTAANDILFIQYLTQSATSSSSVLKFYEGDTLDASQTIMRVEAKNMKITLASAATFNKGTDVVTNANASGYIYEKSGNVLSINEISKAAAGTHFKIGQTVYNKETTSSSTGSSSITAVTHDDYIIFERGKTMIFNGNLTAGNGVIFTISPALPSGLSLNTSTGAITGKATSAGAKKDFIITASNFINSTTYVVRLEVKDYFEIQDASGASSFLLHKVGDYQINRSCRVDSSDIAALSNGDALDIRCFLEGEEQDVFQSDIKFNINSGPGICEYVQYSPYYFNRFSPIQSYQLSTQYNQMAIIRAGCSVLSDSGSVPTPTLCESNYSRNNPTYPNCDEGHLDYWQETYSEPTAGTCVLNQRTLTKVDCGGNRTACLAGPVSDILDGGALNAGRRSVIMPAASGVMQSYTHNAPITHGDAHINVRNANNSVNNQCTMSPADATNFENLASNTSLLASPLGSDSNPFYTFYCLDAAYDFKARIRLVVREWDKTFRIDSNIDNQNYFSVALATAPPADMNKGVAVDPIFGKAYNDYKDWDDAFNGLKSSFSTDNCAVHNAGSCTNISWLESTAQCTQFGGTTVSPGSCSAGGHTSKVTCAAAGNTWTYPICNFANEYQCKLYGGTWTGDEEYKFPQGWLGN